MKVYIGAENIISPLGSSAESCYEQVIEGKSGVRKKKFGQETFSVSAFDRDSFEFKGSFWQHILQQSVESSLQKLTSTSNITHIVSSAKGEIENIERGIYAFGLSHSVKAALGEQTRFHCVSNACISGLLAIQMAADQVRTRRAETVVVTGLDTIGEFVVSGFNSLFALDSERCRPFDESRAGLNLGEAVATVVLSSNREVFKEKPVEYVAGYSNNDANHISGPSRTGEGLKKAIRRTLEHADQEPDFISAHGTGTNYNDAMEAQAFAGVGLANVPINSLKSYFGHTLGAAGLVETIISLQAMKKDVIPGTLGLEKLGTEKQVRVLNSNYRQESTSFLKTCSGFGGGNAAALFRKI